MKRNYFLLACLLVISGFLSSCTDSGPSQPEYTKILEKATERGYPGMILGVQNENGRWIGATGLSNIEAQDSLKKNDRFHLASVTKLFTAVAVFKLIDEGKLSFDTKVIELLDSSLVAAIPNISEINVGHLLDHSSGIYGFNNDMEYVQTLIGNRVQENVKWNAPKLIALAYGDRVEPEGKPGSGHYYGDTNYCLLGLIVKKVSGVPLRQYVKQSILKPLDLKDTGYYSEVQDREKVALTTTVQGYLKRSEPLDQFITLDSGFTTTEGGLVNTTAAVEKTDAAAGMVSTASDLLKFGKALYQGDLISDSSKEWMLLPAKGLEKTGDSKQGVISVHQKAYGILYTSLGDGPGGVNTMLAYHPQSETVVVAFTNIFGNFDEHDFFMDEVVPPIVMKAETEE